MWVVGSVGGRWDSSLDVTTVGSQVQPIEEQRRSPFHESCFQFCKKKNEQCVSFSLRDILMGVNHEPAPMLAHFEPLCLLARIPFACRFTKESVAIPAKPMI